MKFKAILLGVMAAASLASCQGPQGKPLGEIADATAGDSLMYYFGEMRGADYKRQAVRDTTLATKESVRAYLEGVEAGLKALRDHDEAYNRGVSLGMQMATNIQQFEKDYGETLSERLFLDGLATTLTTDSLNDGSKAQQEFHRLLDGFNRQKAERDSQTSQTALAETAKAEKYVELTPWLYAKASPADGERLKEGDKVKLKVSVREVGGKILPAPFPPEMTIGERMKDSPLMAALLAMKPGETGDFYTTGHALFGPRCQQIGIGPASVLKMQVTADRAED